MNDIGIIIATLCGPIAAVQAQKFIEAAREKSERRLRVFYTLMGTRAARVSADHVQALNMIDLVFYGINIFGLHYQSKRDKAVVTAWNSYRDHLNQQFTPEEAIAWDTRANDYFIELIDCISKALGFDFEKVQIKRGSYNPTAHDQYEIDQNSIRKNLVKILNGEASIKMGYCFSSYSA